MQAPVWVCAIGGSLQGALRTTRIVRVLNKFCTGPNESLKAFLTLVEIIEVTKWFLYMKHEHYYFEENEKNVYFIAYLQACDNNMIFTFVKTFIQE